MRSNLNVTVMPLNVNPVSGNGGCRLRPGVQDARIRGAVVGFPPQNFASFGFKRDQLFPFLPIHPGMDKHAAIDDDRSAEPDPNLRPPQYLWRILPRPDEVGLQPPSRLEPSHCGQSAAESVSVRPSISANAAGKRNTGKPSGGGLEATPSAYSTNPLLWGIVRNVDLLSAWDILNTRKASQSFIILAPSSPFMRFSCFRGVDLWRSPFRNFQPPEVKPTDANPSKLSFTVRRSLFALHYNALVSGTIGGELPVAHAPGRKSGDFRYDVFLSPISTLHSPLSTLHSRRQGASMMLPDWRPPPLTTSRLTLRPFSEADAAPLFE